MEKKYTQGVGNKMLAAMTVSFLPEPYKSVCKDEIDKMKIAEEKAAINKATE